MELIKLVNGMPVSYSIAEFRLDNKHTVYGQTISEKHLNKQGVYRVQKLDQPQEIGKKAVLKDTPELVGNVWVIGWDLVPLDADEARSLRNNLLSETDWWATSDRTMTAEQAAYRQALRDITDQAGFPHEVIWPTKPE